MKKYYNAYDRVFIADKFDGVLTNINGDECHGTIAGAWIMIAVMGVHKYSQPTRILNIRA